jgi:hypothetical protein
MHPSIRTLEERMAAQFPVSFLESAFVLFFLSSTPNTPALSQAAAPTPNPHTTYVYFQRTSGHVKLSTLEVFQQVVNEIRGYFSANGVVDLREDNNLSSQAELPLSAVQAMARDSGADYLLYVVVDRPISTWLRVTVRCYDSAGQVMWLEDASSGGGLSGGHAARDTLQKLREELDRRLGQPGLQQSASEQKPASTGSAPDEQPGIAITNAQPSRVGNLEDSGGTIRLANGTPVHLLLVESISSKTAQPGSTAKLQVLDDVKVGDLVVIANKAPATATIETAKEAGRAWRKGSLLLKLDTVMLLNQQMQPLRAWSAAEGKDTGAAIHWTNAVMQSYGFGLLFLPFAPLQHGKEAAIPRGAVLEAVINGDVLLPRTVIEATQPKPSEPRHGPASVTFYYPDFGEGISLSVWCGQAKVGVLKRGGKFTLTLPPGRYWLRTGNLKKSPLVVLDAEDGDEQYVSVIMASSKTRGDLNFRETLAVVPHDVGEAQSAETTSAKSRDVQDSSKLDLTQLLSNPGAKKTK